MFRGRRSPSPARRLVLGLGNPGPDYAKTRHNIGFWCVNRLADGHRFAAWWPSQRAMVTEGTLAGQAVVLVKPLTFMNLSGQAVKPLMARYGVGLDDLLVVYDDLDLDVAALRLRPRGSSGGHKGVQSIIDTLGSQDFARLRLGIGRPVHGDPVDYVLSPFSLDESIAMDRTLARAEEAVVCWLNEGVEAAMNRFNKTPLPAEK